LANYQLKEIEELRHSTKVEERKRQSLVMSYINARTTTNKTNYNPIPHKYNREMFTKRKQASTSEEKHTSID